MKKVLICCIFIVLVLAVIACGLRFIDDGDIICELKVCDDCVNTVDLHNGNAKILLGDKVLDVKIDAITEGEHGGEKLIIGDKIVDETSSMEISFDKLYVFNNEMILVTVTGEVALRSDFKYNYFYDKNLNPVDINLVLDKDYPNSMIQVYTTDLEVEDNKLIIKGSRLNDNLFLISEDGKETKLCKSSGNPTDYTNKHTGELLEARYEAEYLGNYKFSKFKKVEDIRILNEEICYYD